MKKMKPETAYNLKTIFGSLFSNSCAIDAGKGFPFWAAIIVFCLSVFLPIIPTMVSVSNTQGSAYVSGTYNYSFDKDMAGASLLAYNEGLDFIVNEEHKLVPTTYIITPEEEPVTFYYNSESNQYDLQIFYSGSDSSDQVNLLFNKLIKRSFIQGTIIEKSDADPEGTLYYSPSVVLLYQDGLAFYLFKHNTTVPISSSTNFSGDWLNTVPNTLFFERILSVEGFDIPSSLDDHSATNKYISGTFENVKEIMNETYLTAKNKSFMLTTLIYLGVYIGLTILLGLLVFLLTRGKKNLNRYLKFWQCEKITAWASIAPGILAMALGFAIPSYAVMFYILFEGMRIMWMSMKQLSPAYQS